MSARILSLAPLSVFELTMPEAVEAAAAAGYTHLGLRLISPNPAQPAPDVIGDTPLRREVLRCLAATGMRVLDTEVVRLQPGVALESFLPFLETSALLGAQSVVVMVDIPEERARLEAFAAFCQLAKGFGLSALVEFMPWTALHSLAKTRAFVQAAGQPNGRIMLDCLHLDRAGEGAADVAATPPGLIGCIQLCDAPIPAPKDLPTLLHHARVERLPPGQGGLDLPAILAALPPDLPLAVEVPMAERAKTVPGRQRAADLLAATRAVLAAAETLRRG